MIAFPYMVWGSWKIMYYYGYISLYGIRLLKVMI